MENLYFERHTIQSGPTSVARRLTFRQTPAVAARTPHRSLLIDIWANTFQQFSAYFHKRKNDERFAHDRHERFKWIPVSRCLSEIQRWISLCFTAFFFLSPSPDLQASLDLNVGKIHIDGDCEEGRGELFPRRVAHVPRMAMIAKGVQRTCLSDVRSAACPKGHDRILVNRQLQSLRRI